MEAQIEVTSCQGYGEIYAFLLAQNFWELVDSFTNERIFATACAGFGVFCRSLDAAGSEIRNPTSPK